MTSTTEQLQHTDEQSDVPARPDGSAIRSRLLRYTTEPAEQRNPAGA